MADEWRDIATAPEPKDWLRNPLGRCLIGCWHEHRDEDGELTGEAEWSWIHVANLSFDGWRVGTSGFSGLHGHASFLLLENATHWMPLPSPPIAQRAE